MSRPAHGLAATEGKGSTMRRTRTVLAMLLVLTVAVSAVAAKSAKTPPKRFAQTPATAITTLQIEGMSCYSCVARITRTLKGVKGVTDAHVSLAKRKGDVRYVPSVITPDSLARIVTALGYRAKVAPTEGTH